MNENQALYGVFDGSNEVASSAICHAFPKGNFYSQRGNILFPGWECFVPNVGIIFTLNGLSFYSFLEDHGVGSTDHFSALKIWMFENKFVSLPSHLKTIEPMARPIREKAERVSTM